MSALMKALKNETNKTTTTNGMKAFKSSLNANVDLFAKIGAMRGKDVLPTFHLAFKEDQDRALRIALWARDVRQGAGERQIFKDILKNLTSYDYQVALKLLPLVPELGRWDDLLVCIGTPVEKEAVSLIKTALENGNGLCAKWMPRKGEIASKLRKAFGWTPKYYRKTLVELTNVVETKMCNKEWSLIDYSKIPSLASARYQKAFGKNDGERYGQYLTSLVKGETKINAGAVYPMDVLKSLINGNPEIANEQWKALPDFIQEGVNFLPVIDVSGSMRCTAGRTSMTCMDVAISLGMYLAERNKSPFKDHFITFAERPSFVELAGNLGNRYKLTRSADWGGSTDFLATFELILKVAKHLNMTQSDLPDIVVVLSDMQFNEADNNKTAVASIKKMYKEAGFEMPSLMFWNLNSYDNLPAKADKDGVMMVSGFSPSFMKSVVSGKIENPEEAMLNVIMNPRYDWNKEVV